MWQKRLLPMLKSFATNFIAIRKKKNMLSQFVGRIMFLAQFLGRWLFAGAFARILTYFFVINLGYDSYILGDFGTAKGMDSPLPRALAVFVQSTGSVFKILKRSNTTLHSVSCTYSVKKCLQLLRCNNHPRRNYSKKWIKSPTALFQKLESMADQRVDFADTFAAEIGAL